jgi:murein L,D-transpeptidase YcbB/YkuD
LSRSRRSWRCVNEDHHPQAAVRAFQQGVAFDVRGFQVDGVVGPVTRQALVTEVLAG